MEAYELQRKGPPCASRMVDGFVRLSMAGVAYGLFMGSHDSAKEGHKGSARAAYMVKYSGKCSVLWGCTAGLYHGLSCGFERLRGKRDWVNSSMAGAITGALIAAQTRSASQILGTSIALSAFATAVEFLPPTVPPTS